MCLFSFFIFLDDIKALFQGPLEKTNSLRLESILLRCVHGGKYRKVHMIYVPYDFQYNCKENKRKNDSRFSIVLYIALISKHSLNKWKKCVIFFKFSKLSSLCLSSCFCFTHSASEVVFWGAEGLIVSFCVCLFLSFSFFVFLHIQNVESGLCAPTQNVWVTMFLQVSVRRWVGQGEVIFGWVTCIQTFSDVVRTQRIV